MQAPRIQFTMRRMTVAVAAVALVLVGLRWLLYPHIDVTVFNESSAAIRDVRLRFLYGECTADRIESGGYAAGPIQSGGESGVFLTYRDPDGVLRRDQPVHYSDSTASPDRGFLEIHVTNEGLRIVKNIDNFDLDTVSPVIQVRPAAPMTVK